MATWDEAARGATTTLLRRAADPEAATPMRAYMRDQFDFLGVTSPNRTLVWREVRDAGNEAAGRPDGDTLLAYAAWCWEQAPREYQYLGATALRWRASQLAPRHLAAIRDLVQSRSWWDTVDILSPKIIGVMARQHGSVADAMDAWIEDDDVWVVRSALLHQLHAKEDTDVDRLAAHCRARADHPDVFVRKAIGWALRQYSYVDPAWVTSFVEATPMSGLSRREAMKAINRRG